MVWARFATMQRNEGRRLRHWVEHHAAISGHRRLTILDNGSSDPDTIQVLAEARKRGCTVLDFPGRHHFENKGSIVADVIRDWDQTRLYDFAIPCDADERLAVWTDEGVDASPAAVMAELARYVGSKSAFRIDTSLFNVPERAGWYAPDIHFHKSFLPARTIGSLDLGFHWAESRFTTGQRHTRLVWLHEHNGTFAEAQRNARWKLEDRVDLNDPAALDSYAAAGLPGAHLVSTLSMTDTDYRARYDDRLRLSVGPRTELMLPGSRDPVPWNGKAYLLTHPDVARNWELTALQHYTRHGVTEGRLPSSLIPEPTRALRDTPQFSSPGHG